MLNRRLSATKTIYRRENEVSSPKEKNELNFFVYFVTIGVRSRVPVE